MEMGPLGSWEELMEVRTWSTDYSITKTYYSVLTMEVMSRSVGSVAVDVNAIFST